MIKGLRTAIYPTPDLTRQGVVSAGSGPEPYFDETCIRSASGRGSSWG